MSYEERRTTFKNANVHVVNDDIEKVLPMTALSADEVHSVLDIYEARFCHGKRLCYYALSLPHERQQRFDKNEQRWES